MRERGREGRLIPWRINPGPGLLNEFIDNSHFWTIRSENFHLGAEASLSACEYVTPNVYLTVLIKSKSF